MNENDIFIIDGACGTELERMSNTVKNDPLWSSRLLLTNPQVISSLHTRYLEAGANVILTSTYQASIPGLMQHAALTDENARSTIAAAAQIAIAARDEFWNKMLSSNDSVKYRKPFVAGSVGPYGACQYDGSEFHGRYVDTMTVEELMKWHRARIEILIENKVDLLAFETIPAEKEATAVIQVLETFPNMKAWLSFVCKDNLHINHGEKFADVVEQFHNHSQIIAIGTNCTMPQNVEYLFNSCKKANLKKALLAYPNSGESWNADSACWDPLTPPVDFNKYIDGWLQQGIRWIGGCCRTTPNDISKIRCKINEILIRN